MVSKNRDWSPPPSPPTPLSLASLPQSRRPTPPITSVLHPSKQLLAMSAPRTAVEKFWQSIQPGAPAGVLSNASLPPPIVRSLDDGYLALSGQTLPFGHCSVLVRWTTRQGVVSESPALREGGDNNDAPRLTGMEGLNIVGSSVKTIS